MPRGRSSECWSGLIADGFVVGAGNDDDRRNLVNDATQKAIERFDETLRELALRRYVEFEHELEPQLTRFAVDETMRLIRQGMKVKLASAGATKKRRSIG